MKTFAIIKRYNVLQKDKIKRLKRKESCLPRIMQIISSRLKTLIYVLWVAVKSNPFCLGLARLSGALFLAEAPHMYDSFTRYLLVNLQIFTLGLCTLKWYLVIIWDYWVHRTSYLVLKRYFSALLFHFWKKIVKNWRLI